MNYDLQLEESIKTIKETKSKLVCIQLADGLKPEAKSIQNMIEKETDARVVIWADSCFGACDTPLEIKKFGFDLLIQYGHAPWSK